MLSNEWITKRKTDSSMSCCVAGSHDKLQEPLLLCLRHTVVVCGSVSYFWLSSVKAFISDQPSTAKINP